MANGHGGSRKGAGRKSKADELKLLEHGTKAIKEIYGSLDEYWQHIAKESKDSFAHLKLLTEYLYGKPNESLDVTSKGEKIAPPAIKFTKSEQD